MPKINIGEIAIAAVTFALGFVLATYIQAALTKWTTPAA